MFKLMYNGVEVPNFVKVTGIDQYLLPEIEQYNSKIPSSYGNIDGGISYGSKVFVVHYMIIFDGEHNDSYYVDKMAAWLMGNNSKVSKFQMDNSGEYYMARPTDAINMSDAILYGSGDITFVASNPRRYAASATNKTLNKTGNTTVNYTGLVPVCPVITVACPSGTTSVKITNTTTKDYILVSGTLNGTLVIDCDKKFVSLKGVKDMSLLDIKSDWITLNKGDNIINVTVTGTAITSITMKYVVTN